VLDPEKFRDEWLTEKSFQVRMSKDKSVQKRLVLAYEASL
jgi:hypothetical protein